MIESPMSIKKLRLQIEQIFKIFSIATLQKPTIILKYTARVS